MISTQRESDQIHTADIITVPASRMTNASKSPDKYVIHAQNSLVVNLNELPQSVPNHIQKENK